MGEPRQQHYVPRFYLSGFTDPEIAAREKKDVIWVYEKGKAARRSSPEKEAKQRDYYTFIRDGSRDAQIEAWLGDLEAAVAPLILSLSNDPRPVTDSEKQLLAVFIGTMQMRTPAGRFLADNKTEPLAAKLMKEAASDPVTFRAFAEENGRVPGPEDEFDLEEVRKDILAGRAEELAAQPGMNLLGIVEVGKMVADVLLNMSWQLFESEDEPFLISDDPVVCHVISKGTGMLHLRMGVASPGANVWFPLCRTACLRIVKGEESGVGRWVPAGVRFLNKMAIMCAERWVFASQQSDRIKALVDKKGGQASSKTVDFHFQGQRY